MCGSTYERKQNEKNQLFPSRVCIITLHLKTINSRQYMYWT